MFHEGRRSLKGKLLIEIILLMLLLFCVASVVCSFLLYRVTDQNADEQVQLITDSVVQALVAQDLIHLSLESIANSQLKEAMTSFQDQYLAANSDLSKIDLATLKRIYPQFDFFVIDNNNTVVHTSFLPDKNLSFSGFPNVKRFLDHVRGTENIETERAMNSVHDGMKEFIYQVTPDKKYILEIGISFKKFKEILPNSSTDYFDFPNYISKIISRNRLIQSISIYDLSGKPYYSSNSSLESEASEEKKKLFDQLTASEKSQRVSDSGSLYYYELFYPYERNPEGYAAKVIEVALDLQLIRKPIYNAIVTHGFIIVCSLVAAFILASRFARRITLPVEQLTHSTTQIAQGNTNFPVAIADNINELNVLSASVDAMRIQLRTQIQNLNQYNEQLTQSYQQIIQAFFQALEHREGYTAAHSLGVNQIAMDIGNEMSLTPEQLRHLNWGSLLHDIGKLALSDTILLKPDPLTPQEFEQVKLHPMFGFELLPKYELFRPAAEIVLYHHERYDGLGYPKGLSGDTIPLLARICSVADAVHAITSDRPYRKGRPWGEAIAEVVKCSGKQFDPEVVAAFSRITLTKVQSWQILTPTKEETESNTDSSDRVRTF